MHDILPGEMPAWHLLERTARNVFERHGYAEIRVPLVEKTELFARTIGAATDVVEKEMYSFEDRNGDGLSLRPEGTAGVVRAALQNGLLYSTPLRLWYCGPMFRRERPQKGRTRQFHQIGAEVFGAAGPFADAELLAMCQQLWLELGIQGLRLEINSLGATDDRRIYRGALQDYFSRHRAELDEDSVRRLDQNPLRILDSKSPGMQELIAGAPSLQEYLGKDSAGHFETLCRFLDALGITYTVNPRLVRGLDYYSHTVFEWKTDRLGAQGTVCAGGRYDGLVELQGGKPWPGVGFAMGEERLVELLSADVTLPANMPHVFLVMVGDSAEMSGLKLAYALRAALPQLRVQANPGGGSFKTQFRRADKSGAVLALILGEEELQKGTIAVKHLRAETGQAEVLLRDLEAWLGDWLRDQGISG
jgi:histidyl-tRNA synthetase